MSNYKFKLPNQIILDQRLTYTAKKVCALLYAFSSIKYTISVKTISVKSQLSEDTVYTALSMLETCGYIERKRNYEYNRQLKRVVWGKNSYVCKLSNKINFTFVPITVFKEKITAGAFALLLFLRYAEGNAKRSHPSYSLMHTLLGMSKSWIWECLGILSKLSLLYIENCIKQNGAFACNSYFFLRTSVRLIKGTHSLPLLI